MRTTSNQKTFLRNRVSKPPSGRGQLTWFGPGLLWMLSAVGTGSILFTPRVASAYEYDFLWLLVLVVFFMAVMIREMGRYSIVTGRTVMEGMHFLPGPRDWALWFIFVPQLLAAAVGIAGLSAVVGSALAAMLPGGHTLYAISTVVFCTVFTITGQYMRLEKVSRALAMALMLMALVSAAVVLDGGAPMLAGLAPQWPEDTELYLVLPWVGTILAGSMGIVWFGYWTATRGYGEDY
ncbi:MAG: Nramp family divalent metal transporter [Halioglobus sp.]